MIEASKAKRQFFSGGGGGGDGTSTLHSPAQRPNRRRGKKSKFLSVDVEKRMKGDYIWFKMGVVF